MAILMHWLTAVLIVAVYATMDLKSLSAKGSALREAMATWHYVLGLWVFGLVWIRPLLHFTGPTPVIDPAPARWESVLANAVHSALYALMIGLPLLGWLTLSAKGQPIAFLGIELPPLAGKNEALAKQFKDLHEAFATVGYFLVGLHTFAALFHHYVKRDNTMKMMWPRHST